VWCAFPERERLAYPGPGEHIGYTLAVAGSVSPPVAFTALITYTTSQPWTQPAPPPGLFVFDRRTAADA
jgi:hypothetical protein